MGCAQSKIENEEAVFRCKERKYFMKDAVAARNAFAAAHSAYAVALKNTGAALSDYAQAEGFHDPVRASSAAAVAGGVSSSSSAANPVGVKPPMDETLHPPPPLPPEYSTSPLQRSASMPDLPIPKLRRRRNPNDQPSPAEVSILEEEDGDDAEDEARGVAPAPENSPAPPPRPAPQPERSPAPPMPPPQDNTGSWDYFFELDEHLRVASLAERPEEIRPAKDDRDEEAEKYRRSASTAAGTSAEVAGGVDDLPPPPPMTPEKEVVEPPPPPLPKQAKKHKGSAHHQHAASVGSVDAKKGKMVPAATPSVTLLQIIMELDDHFLKASESAQEVSKKLEANRLHYHSNFADNRGHIDHSARVMRAITWNRSFKGLANADDGKDDFDNNEQETLATILDKLLAWEKKLYDEVKASELMKLEYQRKVSLLSKQKKRGVNSETLEKTKAAVSHLHTRYIVDMQSMDSTVSEIQRLRDAQLYPKLSALVDEMSKMWESMFMHHEKQLQIVSDIKALNVSNVLKETSDQLRQRTDQLCGIVDEWDTQFQKLVSHQKEYIKALNNWLRLNVIPIESSWKEDGKVSSPPKVYHPPIEALLQAWHEQLEKLPDERARSAIHSFSAVIKAIKMNQEDELKQKDKCEEIHREYIRKQQAFEDWHKKYSMRRTTQSEETDPEGAENPSQKDPIADRQFMVESLKKKRDEEVENHQKLCEQVRDKSVYSLKSHLPELFRSMSEFAQACSEMYGSLRISQVQNGATS